MTDRTEGRLSRWSRLKQSKRKSARRGAAAPVIAEESSQAAKAEQFNAYETPPVSDGKAAPVQDDAASRGVGAAEGEREAELPEDLKLPDVETLDAASDIKGFLDERVPEALRRQALRAMWRSDPIFANLDGLNDYDENFQLLEGAGRAIQTAYQVGKGYVTGKEPTAEEREVATTEQEVAETAATDETETETVAPEAKGDMGSEMDENGNPSPRQGGTTTGR